MSESKSNPPLKSDEEVNKLLQDALKKSGGKRGGDQRPIVAVEIIADNIKRKGKVWEKNKKPKEKER